MELSISLSLIQSRLQYALDAILYCLNSLQGRKDSFTRCKECSRSPSAASPHWGLSWLKVMVSPKVTPPRGSLHPVTDSTWEYKDLFAIWDRSVGLLRHLLGLHCCSTSPSTQSAFFCSLLQAAIPRALPYICPACHLRTSLPNNPAWNVSSQGKHPGGGSI